jgi:hypothetical protein
MAAKLSDAISKTLPGKRRLSAHGRTMVFARGNSEREQHVGGKALLWALYLPQYPDLAVEVGIGDHYKPDVVALDPAGKPLFWGESGVTSVKKIRGLARQYRDTHFALARWYGSLALHTETVREALDGIRRTAPYDVLVFPADLAQFILPGGEIAVSFSDIAWERIAPTEETPDPAMKSRARRRR